MADSYLFQIVLEARDNASPTLERIRDILGQLGGTLQAVSAQSTATGQVQAAAANTASGAITRALSAEVAARKELEAQARIAAENVKSELGARATAYKTAAADAQAAARAEAAAQKEAADIWNSASATVNSELKARAQGYKDAANAAKQAAAEQAAAEKALADQTAAYRATQQRLNQDIAAWEAQEAARSAAVRKRNIEQDQQEERALAEARAQRGRDAMAVLRQVAAEEVTAEKAMAEAAKQADRDVLASKRAAATERKRLAKEAADAEKAAAKEAADAQRATQGGIGGDVARGFAQGLGVGVPLAAAAATAAVVKFGVDAAKSFGEYEREIREVVSVTGKSGEAANAIFRDMSAQVSDLAVRMGVDAHDAASALYEIMSSGINDPVDAMKVLRQAAISAVGGVTDLHTAADAITSALNAYGLSADHATKVSDILFAGVRDGRVTWDELGRSLGLVLPTAHLVGVSMEEVTGALAAMTNQGVPTQTAMVQLNQLLTAFVRPSDQAKAAARELGIEFGSQSLAAKGLIPALQEIYEKSGGNIDVIARLVPEIRGARAAYQLMGEGAQKASEYIDNAKNSAGFSVVAMEQINQSGGRSFDRFNAQLDLLNRNLGQALIPYLADAMTWVSKVGQELGAWPKDVPSAEQTGRMKELGAAAKDTADVIKVLAGAYGYLDEKIRESNKSGNSPLTGGQRMGAAVKEDAAAVVSFISTLFKARTEVDGLTLAEAALAEQVRAGTLTQAQYEEKLALAIEAHYRNKIATVDTRTEQEKLDAAYKDGALSVSIYLEATKLLKQELDAVAQAELRGEQGVKVHTAAQLEDIARAKEAAAAQAADTEEKAKAAKQTNVLSEAHAHLLEILGNIEKLQATGAIDAVEAGIRKARAQADYEKASKAAANSGQEENRAIAEQLRLVAAGELSFAKFGGAILGTKNELKDLTEGEYQAKLKEIANALQFGKIDLGDAISQVQALATAYNRDLTAAANKAEAESKRFAEEVKRALESAGEDWIRLGNTIEKSQREAYQRIDAIREKHDTDYNSAIADAETKQAEITARSVTDRVGAEETYLTARKKVTDEVTKLEQGQDDATKERALQRTRVEEDRLRTEVDAEKKADEQRVQNRTDTNRRLKEIDNQYGKEGSGGKEAADDQIARNRTVAEALDTLNEHIAENKNTRDEKNHQADLTRDHALADAQDRLDEARSSARLKRSETDADAELKLAEDRAAAQERLDTALADARDRRDKDHAAAQERYDADLAAARVKQAEDEAAIRSKLSDTLAEAELRRATGVNDQITKSAEATAAAAQRLIDQLGTPSKDAAAARARADAERQAAYEQKLTDENAAHRTAIAAAQNVEQIAAERKRHEDTLANLNQEHQASQQGTTSDPTSASASQAAAAKETAEYRKRLLDELGRHEKERTSAQTDAAKTAERERYEEAVRLLDKEHGDRLRTIALASGAMTEAEAKDAQATFDQIDAESRQRISDLQDEEDAKQAAADKDYEAALKRAQDLHDKAVKDAEDTQKDALKRADALYQDAIDKAQGVFDDARDKAQTVHDKAIANAQELYDKALANAQATYDDAADKAERTHKDALAKAKEVYDDAMSKAQGTYDDVVDKQKKLHEDALVKIKEKYEDERTKAITQQDERFKQIDDAEAKERIARKAVYDLQDTREKEDFERRQQNTKDHQAAELKALGERYDEEIKKINTREEADIRSSNTALTKKQEQIDEQRKTDYRNFLKDLSDRMQDIETQFTETVKKLDAAIPGDVRKILNGAAQQISGAVNQVQSAVSSGAATPKAGERDWATYNFLVNTGTSPAEADAKSKGKGAGEAPPETTGTSSFLSVLADIQASYAQASRAVDTASQAQLRSGVYGGDGFSTTGRPYGTAQLGASGDGAAALNWALSKVGQAIYEGACEKFTENAFGVDLIYNSAADAANHLLTHRGGSLADVPAGKLVFFRPDKSNDGYGHSGIADGRGNFVSALYTGVALQGPSAYWNSLYSGWGEPAYPRRAYGGDVEAGRPYLVGDRGDNRPEVFVPDRPGTIHSDPFSIDYQRLGAAVAEALSGVLSRLPAPQSSTRNLTVQAHGADPAAVLREITRFNRRQDLLDRATLQGAA